MIDKITITVAILSILLIACDSKNPTQPETSKSPTTLNEARKLWQNKGFSDYHFRLQRICFCAPRDFAATVHVHDGTVTSITNVFADGKPIEIDYEIRTDDFLSVEQLFNLIEGAKEGSADSVEVNYDSKLGYPKDIFIDYIKEAVDEEISYYVEDVVAESKLVQEIKSVVITTTDCCPSKVTARVMVGHGACDRFLSPEILRDGNNITILIKVQTPPGACIAILVGSEIVILLGEDVSSGDYNVTVPGEFNEKTVTFHVKEN